MLALYNYGRVLCPRTIIPCFQSSGISFDYQVFLITVYVHYISIGLNAIIMSAVTLSSPGTSLFSIFAVVILRYNTGLLIFSSLILLSLLCFLVSYVESALRNPQSKFSVFQNMYFFAVLKSYSNQLLYCYLLFFYIYISSLQILFPLKIITNTNSRKIKCFLWHQ